MCICACGCVFVCACMHACVCACAYMCVCVSVTAENGTPKVSLINIIFKSVYNLFCHLLAL